MNLLKKSAFTLSETMIVVVVLGIIATLTIPALVNKQKESVAKTKVRKAMSAYELAIQKMTIENDLKSVGALEEWANPDRECEDTRQYFKTVEGEGCIFKTSDGLWWNISDIMHPVISLKKMDWEIEGQTPDDINEKADNPDDYTAFYLVTTFNEEIGAFRTNDLEFERNKDKKSQDYKRVKKLYIFLKYIEPDGPPAYLTAYKNKGICTNGAFNGYDENGKIIFQISKPCSVCNNEVKKYDYYDDGKLKHEYSCNEDGEECGVNRTYNYDSHGTLIDSYHTYTYDDDGKITSMYSTVPYGEPKGLTTYSYDSSGNLTTKLIGCDNNGENCSKSERYDYSYENGQKTGVKYSCDSSLNNCSISEKYKYDNTGNIISKFECTRYSQNCGDTTVYEYDSKGNVTKYGQHCNSSGQNCRPAIKKSYDENGHITEEKSCNGSEDNCTTSYTCENTYE